MTFWIIAILLAAIAALPVVTAVFGGRDTAVAPDLTIYRDQLREVERDRTRGVVSEEEAGRIRLEVERRLLEADRRRQGPAGEAPRAAGWGAVTATGALLILGTLGLYVFVGAPGYPDLPLAERLRMAEQVRSERPSQAEAELGAVLPPPQEPDEEFGGLMERLRATLEERPADYEGFRLLAQNEARLGDLMAARQAQARAVEIQGPSAPIEDQVFLGHLMVAAAGGLVTAEAEAVFRRILTQAPQDGWARYYLALAEAQVGRPDRAVTVWRTLLADSSPAAPWVPQIEARIEEAAARAGVRYRPPERQALPGPTAEQMAEMSQMDPEAQQQMIEGMVSGLAERLANEGGTAPEWARLVAAYGQLGRTDRAQAIWDEAQQVFAGTPDNLEVIASAARQAGVAE